LCTGEGITFVEVLETIHQLNQHAHQQAQERLAAGSAAAASVSWSFLGASKNTHPSCCAF